MVVNTFKRSWKLTKLSFGVIDKDREILIYPLLAVFFSLIFMTIVGLPLGVLTLFKGVVPQLGYLWYVVLFVYYLGLSFIATFFNYCVVFTAKKRFEGGDATFSESIKLALSNIHLIFLWSMLAATVGIILKMLESAAEKSKGAGKILLNLLRGLLGLAWHIATIFVIQGIVFNHLTPFKAIVKSVRVLKKTWGESIIRYFGLGLIQFIVILAGTFILGIPLILIGFINPFVWVLAVVILFLYIFLVSLIFGVATNIYNTALYIYATEGKIPEGYSREIMEHAFKAKKKKF